MLDFDNDTNVDYNPAADLEDELCEIHAVCGESFYFCACSGYAPAK